MEFIDSHKAETMALTPESLPEPDAANKEQGGDDTSSFGGQLAEEY